MSVAKYPLSPRERAGVRGIALLILCCALGCTAAWERVDVTPNPEMVRDCQRLGTVAAGKDGSADRLPVLKRLAYEKGADTLLFHGRSSGEAYRCGNAAAKAANPSAHFGSGPEVKDFKVSAFRRPEDVADCKYIAELDDTMLCPFHYYEINHCWAYIAAQQGGNAVLIKSERQVSVFVCPTPSP
jgi:hypothetical protein